MEDFVAVGFKKPHLMYKYLKKAEEPVYSGSIDCRLNLLDPIKIKAAMAESRSSNMNREEKKLF